MRFVQRFKVLTLGAEIPTNFQELPVAWKIERSGNFGGYGVAGWRYNDLAIWHVKVWSIDNDSPEHSYVVLAGEFYPESVSLAERVATQRLIAFWEADGFHSRDVP